MKGIAEYIDHLDDELESAKCYTEKYLYEKVSGNNRDANYYRKMADDELQHTEMLHEMAAQEVNRLKDNYQPTQAMQEYWDRSHVRYVEKSAWIRKMLEM